MAKLPQLTTKELVIKRIGKIKEDKLKEIANALLNEFFSSAKI